MQSEHGLVTVAAFRDPWDAHIARGRLHAEDVLAFVVHENHIWMQWSISQAISGVKLQVPFQERDEALQILAALNAGEYDGLLDDYEPVYKAGPCSLCGSKDLKKEFPIDGLLLLLGLCFFSGIIYPLSRSRQRCQGCGHLSSVYIGL